MGLDMYLTAHRYLSIYDKEGKKTQEKIAKLFPEITLKPETIIFEAMYWRKANMIHKWFVENVQAGDDNCEMRYVTREKLEELYKLVAETLKSKDSKLLPTTEGFFFGGTDYDEYYWEELERTKKELRLVLDNEALKLFDFHYCSSW